MKTRPILMSAPMVRALLEGRKTQTRRIMKPKIRMVRPSVDSPLIPHEDWNPNCPYGKPGDLLWVRETWTEGQDGTDCGPHRWPIYAAEYRDGSGAYKLFKPWKPSIYMPRRASRLTLELTDVRVERLQDISEEDARAEGFCTDGDEAGRIWLAMLWDKINGAGSWETNPWVWALTFKVHQQNVDDILKSRGFLHANPS